MSLKKSKLSVIAIVVLSVIFTACTNNNLFFKSVSIPPAGWYKDEAVNFNVNVDDTLSDYNFYLILRNDNNYRYSNLFVFLNTIMPNGNKTRDTLEIILADNTGKWLGKGWSSIKENKVLLKKNLRFPLKGEYRFFIQQAMRVDTLKGITDVGVQFSKTTE